MIEYHISTQVLHGNALFSGKIYTTGQKFYTTAVVTVVTNINSGSISNGNQLDSLVISQNGNQIRRYDYKKRRGEVSLLIEIVGNERFFYVVSPETLESNFSKLFLLNISKNKFFTLVKDEYPAYRVFKVN